MPDLQSSDMHHRPTVNDVSAPSGISSTLQAVNSIPKPDGGDLCKNVFDFHIFSFFSGF